MGGRSTYDRWSEDIVDGGNCTAVQSQLVNVQSIYSTASAFAALKADGSVVAWGNISTGGDRSNVQEQVAVDVQSIYCSDKAFAALKTDGSIIVWGAHEDTEAAANKARQDQE